MKVNADNELIRKMTPAASGSEREENWKAEAGLSP